MFISCIFFFFFQSSAHLLSYPRPFPLSLLMCALIGCFEPRIRLNWTFQVAWRKSKQATEIQLMRVHAPTHPRARPPASAERNVDQTQSTEEKQLVSETTKQTYLTLVSLFVLFFSIETSPELVRGGGTLFFWRLCACFKREFPQKRK